MTMRELNETIIAAAGCHTKLVDMPDFAADFCRGSASFRARR